MIWLLAATLLVPLAAVSLCSLRHAWHRRLPALMPWAALPGLALALLAPPGLALDLPWLLTGLRLELDGTGRVFLLFTALLWVLAGVYARGYLATDAHASRFAGFFIATCAGNLGLILAADVVGFYLFYALMSFAAYGLIVHADTPEARRAGGVYLVMAILGETLLLIGFLMLMNLSGSLMIAPAVAALAGAPGRETVIALLLAGFGIKAGALLLHMWLPLAHPVAPTPASAVLSGAMIKAGLLGWLRFLPLGATTSDTGLLVMFAGLAAAFCGVAVGLLQRDPKVILAYSSISQMGLMTCGVGLGLLVPEVWPLLLPAVVVYAFHHALTKGALFLGVGITQGANGVRRGAVIGFGLLALALAGAPFTGGALAKQLLKDAAVTTPWGTTLTPLLALAAIATTLLMARLLRRVAHGDTAPRHNPPGRMRTGWWLALAAAVFLPAWLSLASVDLRGAGPVPSLEGLWMASWPVLCGALLAYGGARALRRTAWSPPVVAAGDVLWVLLYGYQRWLRRPWMIAGAHFPMPAGRPAGRASAKRGQPLTSAAQSLEKRLLASAADGALALICFAALIVSLAGG
jgi:formate hydrogenlyase subunit 3/multisubunit Na+/H+ antiporter MnhD subunit